MDLKDAQWRKSSRSGSSGNCVEVANLPGAIALRDSKDLDGPVLVITPAAWTSFINGLKSE